LARPLSDDRINRVDFIRPAMTQTTPREIHMAAVLGGGLIGLALMAFGLLAFSAAFNFSGMTTSTDAFEGATFFGTGAAFFLVSVILLPALRAMQLEAAARMRAP
jgi:hypothetical protein